MGRTPQNDTLILRFLLSIALLMLALSGIAVNQRQKVFMQSEVGSKLRMKGGSHYITLPGSHRRAVGEACQHFDAPAHLFNPGRSNKHSVKRRGSQHGYIEVGLEAVHLPAEGIAPHCYVHRAQQFHRVIPVETADLFCQQNHAGAGAENGESFGNKLFEFADETIFTEKLADGGALAAGDYQPFDLFKLPRQPYGDRRHTQSTQGLDVFRKGTLHRQNADFLHIYHPTGIRDYQPRGASSSFSGIAFMSSPVMGTPIPLDTSAMIAGSL